MPEMKLKQQNMLYNFNSTIKSLETKIVEKLNNCLAKSTIKVAKISQKDYDIKNDIIKVKLKFKKNLINKKN
jgi:multisubunit Na+/H+ antiporter MnhE subunit